MEQIVQICPLQTTNETLIALTSSGNLYLYKPTNPPTGHGTWIPVDLPPGTETVIEAIDHGGRMSEEYQLRKHRNQLFFWERVSDKHRSQYFERQEGAIADARNDYMIRHLPRKAPRPAQPEEESP